MYNSKIVISELIKLSDCFYNGFKLLTLID